MVVAPTAVFRRVILFACIFAATSVESDLVDSDPDWTLEGHGKYRTIYTKVPADSIFRDFGDNALQDHTLEIRLKFKTRRHRWDFSTDAQLITARSDTLLISRELPFPVFPATGIVNDDRRWFKLTHEFTDQGRKAGLIRLDRLNIGYTGDRTVIRFGRQAISWGNGLLYTPMDIFNPFDPTTLDQEYKSGDDMLYGQYLLADGSDIEMVAVVRRNPLGGDVEKGQSSLAIKYHGFRGRLGYDVLLSEHFDDFTFGLGGSVDIGGAVWRGDLIVSDTSVKTVVTGVVGSSYSWVAGKHNWSGAFEYYYNGFGQQGGDYTLAGLTTNPELLQRLARGETFTLGRHYLGVTATVELTPLLRLGPNIFLNLVDPSTLTQLLLSYDWRQDIQVLAALNMPVGAKGTEYGGIESNQRGIYASRGASVFVQLAWYF